MPSRASSSTRASAQVTNGGFELPSSAPPAAGEWQYNGGAVRDGTNPHTGSFEANLDNQSAAINVNVFQQTATGTVTPGTIYTLSFWAQASYGVAGEGQTQISFLNSTGGVLPGSPQFTQIPASAGYVKYTQTYTAPANASAAYVGFNAVTGAVTGASSHVYVDDVAFAPAPEPATLTCVAATAMMLRRKRHA